MQVRLLRLPQGIQSIRFRLSLTYALTVFAAGSVLIGGLYLWQVRQLDELTLSAQNFAIQDPRTGNEYELQVLTQSELQRATLQEFENSAYRVAINNLRQASLYGLGILFVVAFGVGWLLAGWALRPVNRMASVAREISGSDLSRRIGLVGPEDELKYLADTFDAMLDRVQGAFENQRRFVQDASHELRNPLAAARSHLELVLADPKATTGDFRSSAEIAHRSTERMGDLVEDLLSQARTGVPQLESSLLDLSDVVKEVVEEFGGAARQAKVALSADVADEPIEVVGDRMALLRATSNLVSNAVRLSEPNTSVVVRTLQVGEQAYVSVIDQGPGLSSQDQQRVFERFWRGEDDNSGTGLGLSIVKQIAERHAGSVSVESALGIGSTFVLKLPTSQA